jgi:hypothetical protein
MELERLLDSLQHECTKAETSKASIISAMYEVLVWLLEPKNNTSSNC